MASPAWTALRVTVPLVWMLFRNPVPLVRVPPRLAALPGSSERVTGKPELAVADIATLVRSFSGTVEASGAKEIL